MKRIATLPALALFVVLITCMLVWFLPSIPPRRYEYGAVISRLASEVGELREAGVVVDETKLLEMPENLDSVFMYSCIREELNIPDEVFGAVYISDQNSGTEYVFIDYVNHKAYWIDESGRMHNDTTDADALDHIRNIPSIRFWLVR